MPPRFQAQKYEKKTKNKKAVSYFRENTKKRKFSARKKRSYLDFFPRGPIGT